MSTALSNQNYIIKNLQQELALALLENQKMQAKLNVAVEALENLRTHYIDTVKVTVCDALAEINKGE